MKAHENKVQKLNKHTEVLVANQGDDGTIQADVEAFNTRWDQTFAKLGRIFSELSCLDLNLLNYGYIVDLLISVK